MGNVGDEILPHAEQPVQLRDVAGQNQHARFVDVDPAHLELQIGVRRSDFDETFSGLAVHQRRDLGIANQRNEILSDVARGQPQQRLRRQIEHVDLAVAFDQHGAVRKGFGRRSHVAQSRRQATDPRAQDAQRPKYPHCGLLPHFDGVVRPTHRVSRPSTQPHELAHVRCDPEDQSEHDRGGPEVRCGACGENSGDDAAAPDQLAFEAGNHASESNAAGASR